MLFYDNALILLKTIDDKYNEINVDVKGMNVE